MDPNLLFWKSHGQSFFSRLKIWFDLLAPGLLLSSEAEIQKAHSEAAEQTEQDAAARVLSLSSVHADSGAVIPLVFRPPALMPVAGPLALLSFLPHSSVKQALFWQLLLQSYIAGFNHANRNRSSEQKGVKASTNLSLLMCGTVANATVFGALPQIIVNRLGLARTSAAAMIKSVLPIPLSAALAFFSVSIIRSPEAETGIQVFDSNGNPVGVSKAAGEKAVRETSWSRAALFGTTALVPNTLVFLLNRTRLFQRNSLLVVPVRLMGVAAVMGLMVPVSFSMFPQLGTITREELEAELQAAAADGPLLYHRGL